MNLVPEEFLLSDFKYDLLLSESVKSCSFSVLNMTTCSDMPTLDDEVNFKGFGGYELEESASNNNNLNEDSPVTSLPRLASKEPTVHTQFTEDDSR